MGAGPVQGEASHTVTHAEVRKAGRSGCSAFPVVSRRPEWMEKGCRGDGRPHLHVHKAPREPGVHGPELPHLGGRSHPEAGKATSADLVASAPPTC